jgi:hypothetical protein
MFLALGSVVLRVIAAMVVRQTLDPISALSIELPRTSPGAQARQASQTSLACLRASSGRPQHVSRRVDSQGPSLRHPPVERCRRKSSIHGGYDSR